MTFSTRTLRLTFGLVGMVLCSYSLPGQAQSIQLGLGYSAATFEQRHHEADASLFFIAGSKALSEVISVDFRFGRGIGSENIERQEAKVAVKDVLTGLLRLHLPLSQYRASPFLAIGLTHASFEIESDRKERDSQHDMSLGIGASYEINKSVAVQMDYLQYLDTEDISLSGFNLGVRWAY